MKKLLLSVVLGLSFSWSQGQNLFMENFDTFANLATAGWVSTNQSSPAGAGAWAQGGGTAFSGGGYNGGPTSFTLVNYTSTTGGTGTISNWLITPVINVQNGDVITFYTRKGGDPAATTIYPDRLEMRLSLTGAATTNPVGATSVGSFTTLAVSVNPTLTTTGYPFAWTQYSYTVEGLSGPTDVKIGFRYFVTNGGPTGTNSDIIAIDALSVDRPTAAVNDFFAKNILMYPNPASSVINLESTTTTFSNIQITDINGRTVKNVAVNALSQMQINVSDLNAGVYFVKVQSEAGAGSAKFVKN